MKRQILLLIIFLMPGTCFAQIGSSQTLVAKGVVSLLLSIPYYKDTIIDMGEYKVLYSQRYESPLMVSFSLYKPPFHAIASRAGMDFRPFKGVRTTKDVDYQDTIRKPGSNPWDKGHLASAQSFATTDSSLRKTFNYINCGLQYYQLNRGPWETLEEFERKWAQDTIVDVKCGTLFVDVHGIILTSMPPQESFMTSSCTCKMIGEATIPTHFYKKLTKRKESLYYVFPNKKCDKDIDKYKVSESDFYRYVSWKMINEVK